MNVGARPAESSADPGEIWRLINGFAAYWTVRAAIDLEVFIALADGPRPAGALAAGCGGDEPATRGLLDALVGLGLLRRDGANYLLTGTSAAFLLPSGERSMTELVRRSPGPHENWPVLAATIRSRHPPLPVDDGEGSFFRDLARATFPLQYAVARATLDRLEISEHAVRRILEPGAGSAPWSIAVLERCPSATAVVNDLPAVLPEAERAATRHGVADRCRFVAADYRTLELAQERFDLVVLGHVCRNEGAAGGRSLVAQNVRALEPGGRLVIAEYFTDDNDLAGSLHALLLGVTMIAATERGTAITRAECQRWLTEAGLEDLQFTEPIPRQQVYTATRAVGADDLRNPDPSDEEAPRP